MSVAGLTDLQAAVGFLHQPAPARAEDSDCLIRELFLEILKGAEALVDCLSQRAGRLATTVRAQAVPEEGVVPNLSSVVEDRAFGLLDDLLQRHVLKLGTRNLIVQIGDVGLMMLAVMVL